MWRIGVVHISLGVGGIVIAPSVEGQNLLSPRSSSTPIPALLPMIWVLAVIVVGLMVVIAELLLTYQKRAHDLRKRQEPLRRRIRRHTQAMREAVSGIQGSAESQVEDLDKEAEGITGRINTISHRLEELERLVFGSDHDPDAPPAEEVEEVEEDEDVAKGKESVGDLARQVREKQEELKQHRISMLRDVEVAKRTLGLLESKLRSAPKRGVRA